MPPAHINQANTHATPGHVADNHRCFACHRPYLYNVLQYSQRYPNLVLLLALLSTQRRLRIPKLQTPLLTPWLWYATAWSFVSRFALVGGYIWYALRDDPPAEEGGRDGQGGQAGQAGQGGQEQRREGEQMQSAGGEGGGDGQPVEDVQQSAQTTSADVIDEQESAATGDEGGIEQDIGGGTDLSSDNLFDALARSPTEDEIVS